MTRRTLRLAAALCLLGAHTASARDVPVATAAQLTTAIAAAAPGDVITLADGTYALTGVTCRAVASPASPIVVRAANPLGAQIRFDALEGFHVTGAAWHFEGLDVRGVCANDTDCEHAFHVTGGATDFVLRGSRVFDFNAQVKVNSDMSGTTWLTPHRGLIEGNEFADAHARSTSNPVTKVNIDTGDDWIVRANYIHDHHKAGGDNTSYGTFMKGGGKRGLFERNLVVCSKTDTSGGTRIGLSFGGGGTANQFCAPAFDAAVMCDPEHDGGTLRNNVVISCSDVGIYLNRAHATKVLYNTLIATAGIDFRYASSTGEAVGNVLAGTIRARDTATFTGASNQEGLSAAQLAGFYRDPLNADLRAGATALGSGPHRSEVPDDYCARARPAGAYTLGALELSLGDCVTTRPPIGVVVPGSDAGVESDGALTGADSGRAVDGGAAGSGGGGCGCQVGGRDGRGAWLGLALLGLCGLWRARPWPRT